MQEMGYQEVEPTAGETIVPAVEPPTETIGFSDLGLVPEIIAAVERIGWKEPTPVQRMSLPLTLTGREIAAFAQTGTGKTGVFLMTFAQRILEMRKSEAPKDLSIKGIVLVPTRELAMQITQDAQALFEQLEIKSLAVYGGENWDKQKAVLEAGGVDLIVATPGRLKDYDSKKIADLSKAIYFVCDEVDRMFDMGFIEDVEYFLGKIPETCQKLLFSATTSEQVKELAFGYLDQPEYISLVQDEITPDRISQHAVMCSATQKLQVMLGMLREHQPGCALIFANTKLVAEWLYYKLIRNSIDADIITGDLPQPKRTKLIKKIKNGEIKVLIATDVVSRGLHISDVTHVYNFDIPEEAANYVHRIGRTARAGATGQAFSLICDDYGENFEHVKKLLGENAPVAQWFPQHFLDIVDQAPDPFSKENMIVDTDRPTDLREREPRGGGRGPRDSRSEDDTRRDGESSRRGASSSGRPHKGPKKYTDPNEYRNEQRGGRGAGRDDRSDRSGARGDRPRHGRGDRPDFRQDRGQDRGPGRNRGDKRRDRVQEPRRARGALPEHSTIKGLIKKEPLTFKVLIKRIFALFMWWKR